MLIFLYLLIFDDLQQVARNSPKWGIFISKWPFWPLFDKSGDQDDGDRESYPREMADLAGFREKVR